LSEIGVLGRAGRQRLKRNDRLKDGAYCADDLNIRLTALINTSHRYTRLTDGAVVATRDSID
jgi:hypothetical protein